MVCENEKYNTKEMKLVHYAEKSLRRFRQHDIHTNIVSDDIFTQDEDGDVFCWGETDELMNGAALRILTPIETTDEELIRLLKKQLAWLEGGLENG